MFVFILCNEYLTIFLFCRASSRKCLLHIFNPKLWFNSQQQALLVTQICWEAQTCLDFMIKFNFSWMVLNVASFSADEWRCRTSPACPPKASEYLMPVMECGALLAAAVEYWAYVRCESSVPSRLPTSSVLYYHRAAHTIRTHNLLLFSARLNFSILTPRFVLVFWIYGEKKKKIKNWSSSPRQWESPGKRLISNWCMKYE